MLAEAVSTLVLVVLIVGLARTNRSHVILWTVGGSVGAAILATTSTAFANPTVTLARSVTDTYAGIAPGNVAAFIVAQVAGAILAITVVGFLCPVHAVRAASTESREETLV